MDLTSGLNVVKEGGKIADDLVQSGEERDDELTQRLEIDMKSDNWLSKSIRPITLIWLLALMTLIPIVEAFFDAQIPTDTKVTIGTLLLGAVSFYFPSKRAERVAQKNAEANLKMRKLEAKERRRDKRHERKLERQAAKD